MKAVLEVREKIYNHIQNCSHCQWHDRASHDEFISYCVAKDTIQDTAEALSAHRSEGFSDDIYKRYIEYYGILQAVYMQQDAIKVLHNLFLGKDPGNSDKDNWNQLRDLRNDTVGHPVERRNFLNRLFIGYDRVKYHWWPKGKHSPKFSDVNLAKLIDGYEQEAESVLGTILAEIERNCTSNSI